MFRPHPNPSPKERGKNYFYNIIVYINSNLVLKPSLWEGLDGLL